MGPHLRRFRVSVRNSKHWLTKTALQQGYREQSARVLLPTADVAVVELYLQPSSGDVEMYAVDRKVRQFMTNDLVSFEHHVFGELDAARTAFKKLAKKGAKQQ